MPKIFWKYKDEFAFYFQLLIVIVALFLTTLGSLGWDWSKVNYTIFGVMTFYSIYVKSIAMNYAFNTSLRSVKDVNGIETNEISILEGYIVNYHHELLNTGRTSTFTKALMYRNYLFRVKNLLIYYDAKGRKDFAKREKYSNLMKVLSKMKTLLEENQFKEFDKYIDSDEAMQEINITKVQKKIMKKSNMRLSFILSTKGKVFDEELDGGYKSVQFNRWSYSFSTQALMIILVPLLQFLISGLTTSRYTDGFQIWVDLLGYLTTIGLSLFTGIRIGIDAANEGYKGKLQAKAGIIKDIELIEKELVKS